MEEEVMNKHSAQLTSGKVVMVVLGDTKGRVPEGNIPLNIEDPTSILGAKYDETAEETEDKTEASFTHPSENHYFDNDGNEQPIPTP
tara:strand:+ start:78 stop:338 length:261 start_codon:yes stop_codon:yes gene_type:complete